MTAADRQEHQYRGKREISDRMGVTERTIDRLIASGALPAYQLDGVRGIRIRVDDADRLLRRITPKSAK